MWGGLSAKAQDSLRLRYFFGALEPPKSIGSFIEKNAFADSAQAHLIAGQVVQKLQDASYLDASCDSLVFAAPQIYLYFSLGAPFFWASLSPGNLAPLLQSKISFKPKQWQNRPFEFSEFQRLADALVRYSETQGYPFATVRLDSFQVSGQQISGAIQYQSGPLIAFDTLQIAGNVKIKPAFLSTFLRIRKDKPFDQNRLNQVAMSLRRLPFLRLVQPVSVKFQAGKAYPQILLMPQKSGQVDGILGVLPNQERPNEVLLTGEFNLQLNNLFQTGKIFKAQWQRLRPESQLLQIEYEHPCLFRTNLDLQFKFYLLREDSSFLNLDRRLDLLYALPNATRVGLFASYKQSTAGTSAQTVRTATILPPFADTEVLMYGLTYEKKDLDDFFFPKKGKNIRFDIGIGNRNVLKNPLLSDSLYRDVILSSPQVNLTILYQQYWRLSRRSIFTMRAMGGYIFNNSLFLNDLFRLGGLNNLRGHNQNQFFASGYGIATIEYRFFIEQETYFYLFYDQALLQRQVLQNLTQDTPLGFGVGLSFSVKAGILNFVYALGQSNEQSISFDRSKIHFGIVSRF
ncbi:MAG TPA: hypothetical protein DCM08_12125 [Microscillaceae bacterium]|jgi:outer membrane protein assembly factor BamA|nr:hypothetical protein [Microscillaceae bacterium]